MSSIPQKADRPLPEQLLAADPTVSVWVSAAAGTGKTRILVDRLLRLLLRGVQPQRILCITFTTAAAGQIEERIRRRIMDWTIKPASDVQKDLDYLLGHTPDTQTLQTARSLFGRLLNNNRPLAIQTIHSFCQSVLARFPLEAGLLPGFSIASDAQNTALQQQAFQEVLTFAAQQPLLQQAVQNLFGITDRLTLLDLLTTLQHQQSKWFNANAREFGPILHGIFDLPYPYTPIDHQAEFYAQTKQRKTDLQHLVGVLSTIKGTTTGPKFASAIATFLDHAGQPSAQALDDYLSSALTAGGTINAHLSKVPDKLSDSDAHLMRSELERLAWHRETAEKVALLSRNHDVLLLAQDFVIRYAELKRQFALLDYNDQIQMTANLLTQADQAPWVMYKLDGGIQHLLVDEAQDTSPSQWRIIKALTMEMLAGSGQYDAGERSVFIVGDEKQSIYSFQDADIASYQETRQFLNEAFATHGLPWRDIQLTTNFRSSPAILSVTDGIFADPFLKSAITHEERVTHTAWHNTRSGSVTSWPLIVSDVTETDDDYLPVTVIQERKATQELSLTIADTIKNWLRDRRVLPRLGRSVRPGDILILLQRRHPLLNPLIKVLKDLQIPVTGIDRMVLSEQLIVRDMLALLQVMLQPHDDLTFAALLKSPLFNISEQQLFGLAYNRDGMSLYQRLESSQTIDPAIKDYLHRLFDVYQQGAGPYHLLSFVTNRPCPADGLSGRHALIKRLGFDAQDALDELLNTAMRFEQNASPDIQMFLQDLRLQDTEIKRDVSNENSNAVRIMTVHGAKGLQAPVVFLADASAQQNPFNSQRDLLWAEDMPFWTTKPREHSELHQAYLKHVKDATDEYYRLLYVALTRAEDELHITGWQDTTHRGKDFLDWHSIARNYLEKYGEPVELAYGTGYRYQFKGTEEKQVTIEQPSLTATAAIGIEQTWLWRNPPAPTEHVLKALHPSRGPYAEPSVISPLAQQETGRFARGTIIHKVLQYLVGYPFDAQSEALHIMLARPEFALSEQDQDALHDEIYKLISQPDTRFIFSKQDRTSTETALAGTVSFEGQDYALTGKIDRLVHHDDAWWIIDYKTNRPPATTVDTVPDAYLFQMAAYRALLQALYPNDTINAALVWTHTAQLMILPADVLDKIIPARDSVPA